VEIRHVIKKAGLASLEAASALLDCDVAEVSLEILAVQDDAPSLAQVHATLQLGRKLRI